MTPVFLAAICFPAANWLIIELADAWQKTRPRRLVVLEHRSPAPRPQRVERRTVAGATPRTVSSRLPVSGWGWE